MLYQNDLLFDYARRAQYLAADDRLAPASGRVVFLGDSMFERWSQAPDTIFSNPAYIQRGIGGQTTEKLLLRMQQDVVALEPASVVIMGGINDISAGLYKQRETMDNYRAMGAIAEARGIKVVFVSVLPANLPDPARQAQRFVFEMNQGLQAICKERNYGYVDLYSQFATPDGHMKVGLSTDGEHPSTAGYGLMKPLIEAEITASLSSKRTVE